MTRPWALQQAGDGARQVIGQAELLPVIVAQRTWRARWTGRRVLVFVDNDSARHALIRGGSPSLASAHLVSEFWRTETALVAYAWIERVPSASNIADGPSRLRFSQIRELGGRPVSPVQVRAHELTGVF